MKHLQRDLDKLQRDLLTLAGSVEEAIHKAIRALRDRQPTVAREVIEGDSTIDAEENYVEEECLKLLALQPMASDLRFLTAAIKINNDLERMGDLAVKIAERALSLMEQPPVKPEIDIPQVARLAESMVRRSLDAFVKRDSELARSVLTADDEVDDLRSAIYEELIRNMQAEPATIPQCVNLMSVVRSLERIADHSTNIAEDVLYLVEGIDVTVVRQAGQEQRDRVANSDTSKLCANRRSDRFTHP